MLHHDVTGWSSASTCDRVHFRRSEACGTRCGPVLARHFRHEAGSRLACSVQTITEEWANSHSIARLWAEYDTIARHANEDRYVLLVASSGLTTEESDQARASEAWGPLMTAFGEAESRRLDLDRAVPALVRGRIVRSADDIAALLHGRVTKWIKSSGDRMQADRIVGLFPATVGVTDQDVVQGLQERRELIEQRARSLTMTALGDHQPWTLKFGRPPADADGLEDWLRRLDTIAAYRDRWQVSGNAILGAEPRSREQMAQRQAGQRAASAALDVARTFNSSGEVGAVIRDLEPGSR
jgi:hypothetical protein